MTECELWTGFLNDKGYGGIGGGGLAHRAAFALANPSVDIKGLHIHHLCGTPACVKAEHLKAMDPSEHQLLHKKAARVAQTQCVNGHEYTDENTGHQTDKDGYTNRYCRECNRIRVRRSNAKNYVAHPKPTPTHCPQGHEYNERNAKRYVRPDGSTKLSCRECNRLRAQASRTSQALSGNDKERRKLERKDKAVESRETRTHCKHGHEWTDTTRYVTGTGTWSCRVCKAEAKRSKKAARLYKR